MSWEQVLSNEVLDIRDGTHDSPKYKDSGYPLITSKNLKQGKIDFSDISLISEEDYKSINKRSKVDKGDILYSMIGSIGNYAFVNEDPNYAIKNVALFKFTDERLNNKYFMHLLNSFVIQRQIERAMKGGTQKFVSLKILRNLKIPLPPIDQQKQIASLLDATDSYRQKTKALIEKYDALTQSLFLDMFGDPMLNTKNWDIFCFKQILEIRNGKNQKKVLNPEGQYPIYGSGGVMDYADDYISNENSVIIGRKGNINKPILVKEKFWHVDTAFGLNPIKEKISYYYLYFFCVRYNFEKHNKTVTIPSLTKSTLLEIEIPLPPLEQQLQFEKYVKAIEAQKALAQQELDKADQLFNSLLQKAFKGQLV